ncbi:hypothetical protein JCGZ_03377 [Jatropha curcas]|uniref:Uncharacterized protein n=1 Tax=Jatropha curcas TaxID=180498 RepID=A0A067JD71_JATCU|nr:hypothetical protein JCGZ_03377 [Jatropha curcas]
MENTLKSAEAAVRGQEARHKADINARDAELEKLKEENWDLLAKNRDLELRRTKIIAELKVRDPSKDWSWVNDIFPNDEEEGEKEEGAKEIGGDSLQEDPIMDGSPPQQVDTEANIHSISSEGRGPIRDLPSGQDA